MGKGWRERRKRSEGHMQVSLIFGFNQLKYLIFPPRYGTRVDYIFCGQEVMACWKAAKAWHSPKKINENHHPVFVVFNNQSCLEDPTSCIEYQEPEEQRGVGLNDAPPAPQQHRQEQQQQEPQEVQQQQNRDKNSNNKSHINGNNLLRFLQYILGIFQSRGAP